LIERIRGNIAKSLMPSMASQGPLPLA